MAADIELREGRWGTLLTIPTQAYLEGPNGPISVRDVEWVDVSTSDIMGGIAGRPRKMVDITEQILSFLRGTQPSLMRFDEAQLSADLEQLQPALRAAFAAACAERLL